MAQGELPAGASADVTLGYSSADVFTAINSGKLDLKKAILTGKFKVRPHDAPRLPLGGAARSATRAVCREPAPL
jgi:hypothetical protein